jgi:hypothetical protein
MNVKRYAKAVVALCGAVAIAVGDGILDVNDGITIALAVLAAIGVYLVPNTE